MNNFIPLILPAVFGLVAGVSHGFVSHYHELPMSLGEQITQPLQGNTTLRD
ncbi:MAG: hypothetical protein AAF703_18940 [Cyanobacteria bacterium P01_D01_bin.105]